MSKPLNIRTFVSHCVDDKKFVFDVCDLLSPYLDPEQMFLFEKRPAASETFIKEIDREISRSDLFIMFVGQRFDRYMDFEMLKSQVSDRCLRIVIAVNGVLAANQLPQQVRTYLDGGAHFIPDTFTSRIPHDTIGCAIKVLDTLRGIKDKRKRLKKEDLGWDDQHVRYGLPSMPHIFGYEKDIIKFYVAKQCYEQLGASNIDADPEREGERRREIRRRHTNALGAWSEAEIRETLRKGVAASWPKPYRYPAAIPTPLSKDMVRGGESEEALVSAAALMGLTAPGEPLTFPEAGPRPLLALPTRNALNVAIVVAGGIAPGINAVIDAIVQRHYAYHDEAQNGHREAKSKYTLHVIGLKNGLLALQDGRPVAPHIRKLTPSDTSEHATRGGSMLGTSRDDDLLSVNPKHRSERLDVIAEELCRQQIDVLYVIGGDGSMKAAHTIWHKVNSSGHWRMSVVAVPKTMDNDILWVWQSFGFLSAVEEAREMVERLHMEVRSNPRLGVVQFFGSDSGYVVSHAVLAAATGHTMLALIPELDFSVIGAAIHVKKRLWETIDPDEPLSSAPAAPIDPCIPHGLIVLAETAIPVDALECLGIRPTPADNNPDLSAIYQAISQQFRLPGEKVQGGGAGAGTNDPTYISQREYDAIVAFFDNGRRVQGQTSDGLRTIGVKILSTALSFLIRSRMIDRFIDSIPAGGAPDWDKLRMLATEPRYLVRALEPSTSDIINGQRLGILAVDAAMAGYTDCMVSQWLTEFVMVPLDLVVVGRKRIPPKGMFWKSVAAKTQQPDDLVLPYGIEGMPKSETERPAGPRKGTKAASSKTDKAARGRATKGKTIKGRATKRKAAKASAGRSKPSSTGRSKASRKARRR